VIEFPILYSRTSTGAVQRWQIKVYCNCYWTESGQIDGVITKSMLSLSLISSLRRDISRILMRLTI
jgi:hypothetical protein